MLKAKRIPRRAEAPGRREPKDISAVKTLVPTELASRRFFLRCPHQGGCSLWPVCPTAATGQFQACLLQARLAAQCFEALRLLQARSAARCLEPPLYLHLAYFPLQLHFAPRLARRRNAWHIAALLPDVAIVPKLPPYVRCIRSIAGAPHEARQSRQLPRASLPAMRFLQRAHSSLLQR